MLFAAWLASWTHKTSPTCDLCNAHDVPDEQHALFHCTHPHVVSLRMTNASLFPSTGLNNVPAFLGQKIIKLCFFHHALIVFMNSSFLFFPLCQSFSMEAPYIPHALPSQTVFDFLSQRHKDSAISFRTLWTIFWLAKTSNKPISLTTWLVVAPYLVSYEQASSRTF